jgi:small-conductance mechanosensitive channel
MGQTKIFDVVVPLTPLIVIPAFVFASILAGLIVLFLFKKVLKAFAARTKTEIDDIILMHIDRFLIIWILLGVVFLVNHGITLIPLQIVQIVDKVLIIALTITIIICVTNIVLGILANLATKVDAVKHIQAPIKLITKVVLIIIGILIVLDTLNISISPILATLGIGSIAVALALQDTLANFFAGLYITADQPIRVGDYIKLDTGEQGYVIDIGWRSTRIRELPNNVIVIPNQKLSQSIIKNYYLPEKRMALLMNIGVSYGSDTRKVEKILVEVTKESAKDIDGLLAEPEPFVRFIPGYGDSSLDFTLICQVREFVDQYYVQHELRHRIFERFKKEGIEIPFPQRTLHVGDELARTLREIAKKG